MRTLLKICAALLLSFGCAGVRQAPPAWTPPASDQPPLGGEGLQNTVSALHPNLYSLGNIGSRSWIAQGSSNIESLYKETQFPVQPINPDATFQFVDAWQINNGGTASIGVGGVGTGNLNEIFMQVQWHVDASIPNYVGYWVISVGVYTTDGAGNDFYNTVTGWTFWPRDHMQLIWTNNHLTIYSFDSNWNFTGSSTTVTVAFLHGTMPVYAMSPKVTFVMDTDGAFGGCMHDVPNYDQNLVTGDLGDYQERNLVGTTPTSATTPVYMSTPNSNSKCSMNVNTRPSGVDYDNVQWTVQGF